MIKTQKAVKGKSDYNFSFGIRSNTTYAPSGAKLTKKISLVHLNDIVNRRVRKKEDR